MLASVLVLLFGTALALPERLPFNSTTSAKPYVFGTVELYESANFKGLKMSMPLKAADSCYNIDCFNDKASSAKWDLPADGIFDSDAYLTVFTKKNCKGKVYAWNLRDYKNDSNLAVKTDMNDQMSSIMVRKTRMSPKSYVKTCSGGTTVTGGPSPLIYD